MQILRIILLRKFNCTVLNFFEENLKSSTRLINLDKTMKFLFIFKVVIKGNIYFR